MGKLFGTIESIRCAWNARTLFFLSMAFCHFPNASLAEGNDVRAAASNQDYEGYGSNYSKKMETSKGATTQSGNQVANSASENSGGGSAKSLASQLFSIGTGLIAAGVATNAACRCGAGFPMIALGAFTFIPGGQGASSSGDRMFDTAALSNQKLGDLSNLGNYTKKTGTTDDFKIAITGPNGSGKNGKGGNSDGNGDIGNGNGANGSQGGDSFRVDSNSTASSFKFDPQANGQGKTVESLNKLQSEFGIDPNDFTNAMLNGKDLGEYLQNHGALGGKSLEEFRSALNEQKINPEDVKEKFDSGEYDEYKGAITDNSAVAYTEGGGKSGASGAAPPKENQSIDQVLKDIFGEKSGGATSVKDLAERAKQKVLTNAASKDAQIRALASNGDYHLSRDYALDALYTEKTLFERVNRIYRQETTNLLPEDFYIRMQSAEKIR